VLDVAAAAETIEHFESMLYAQFSNPESYSKRNPVHRATAVRCRVCIIQVTNLSGNSANLVENNIVAPPTIIPVASDEVTTQQLNESFIKVTNTSVCGCYYIQFGRRLL